MGSLTKTMSKKARKTLALVNAPKNTKLVTLSNTKLVAPKTRPKARRRNRSGRKRRNNRLSNQITPAGTGFLKCAMAPADFMSDSTGFAGIPDEFSGQTIRKSHKLTGALNLTSGSDYYVVMLPIPGYAYFYGHRTSGGTGALTLTGVPYGDSSTIFPSGAEDTYFNAFRYASNVIEIVNATNEMTWSGIIEAWKSKICLTTSENTTIASGFYNTIDIYEGFSTLNGTEPGYVAALKDGVYMPAFNAEEEFDFTNIRTGLTFAELNENTQSTTNQSAFMTLSGSGSLNMVGFGNLEAMIIKLPSLANNQALEIRTWCCIEYQVPNTSPFYDFSQPSPCYDPLALELYKQYRKRVPTAVSVAKNASFWMTFVDWVERAASLASYIPGPVGSIATGVQSVISGVRGLL